jgi:hypothetical protein
LKNSTSIAPLLICLATSVIGYGAGPEQTVALTKPDDIRHASLMDQAIVRLSNKVMECVRGKLAPDNRCFCLYPQEVSQVRKIYEETIRQHPEWRNKMVSYTQEERTFAVSFDGLSRQLDIKCSQGG